jgi:hypothetical protein
VRALNEVGGDWSVPEKGIHDIVDRYSTDVSGNELRMQVVRASNNDKLWQELNEVGSAAVEYMADTVAREVIEVILKKSKRYPAKQKREMTLVLDAARTPSHTFQRVLDAFRARHLEECQKAGFAQVWAVGPQDCLVTRLDR